MMHTRIEMLSSKLPKLAWFNKFSKSMTLLVTSKLVTRNGHSFASYLQFKGSILIQQQRKKSLKSPGIPWRGTVVGQVMLVKPLTGEVMNTGHRGTL